VVQRLREKPSVSHSRKKAMTVLTGFERKIREKLRALSFYDAAVLLILLAFTTLFLVYPMPELKWDTARQGMSAIFWHDVIRNVVLTGRFDSLQEFVATYLKQYESDFFYYPVFYELVLGSSFLFFGISEATLYFVVLLFALASIVGIYLLASRLYDRRIGVISSLFFASSQGLFAYTKSGEIDVPAAAMVTLSILAFLKAETDKRWRYSVLAGILVGLSFMTKPTTVIVMAPFAVCLILKYLRTRDRKMGNLIIPRQLEKRNPRKELSKFGILLVTALVLGMIQMYIWISSGEIYTWIHNLSGPHLVFPWYSYFSWIFTEYLPPIVVALFMIGFVFSLGRRNNADVFLLTWFITFISFFSFISAKEPRYLFVLVPCLSIIAAQGLVSAHNLAKEKMKIQKRKTYIKNLTKTLFILLIILGIVNGVILIGESPYFWVDFENIDESPYDEVAKFLVERPCVICVLPEPIGWVALKYLSHPVLPLQFHVLKHDRQRATNFYRLFFSIIFYENMTNETFLASLDLLSDYHGKTVYVVVPHVNNWSRESLEIFESSTQPSVRTYVERFLELYSYIESHSELIPLVKVFKGAGLEIRVYQRIKGAL